MIANHESRDDQEPEHDKVAPDEHRLVRIETKLDNLAEGFLQLVRMDERMVTLFKRMDGYDLRQERIADKMAEVERVTIGRGQFFRWIDRIGLAMIGALSAMAIHQIMAAMNSGG